LGIFSLSLVIFTLDEGVFQVDAQVQVVVIVVVVAAAITITIVTRNA